MVRLHLSSSLLSFLAFFNSITNSTISLADGSSKCQIQAPSCDQGGERRSYCLNPGQLCGFGLSYTLNANHKVQPYCTGGEPCDQTTLPENGYLFSYKLVDSTLCPENLGCCRVYATPTQGQGELPSSESHADATPTYDETQQKEYDVGESDTDPNSDQLFDS